MARSPRATAVWKVLVAPRVNAARSAFRRSSSNAASGGSKPRGETVVRTCRHTPFGDLTEAPERGCQRQHRKCQKRADQLKLETTQHLDPSVSPITCRYVPWEVFSAAGGSNMRSILVRALAVALAIGGAGGALALPMLLLGADTRVPHALRSFARPARAGASRAPSSAFQPRLHAMSLRQRATPKPKPKPPTATPAAALGRRPARQCHHSRTVPAGRARPLQARRR